MGAFRNGKNDPTPRQFRKSEKKGLRTYAKVRMLLKTQCRDPSLRCIRSGRLSSSDSRFKRIYGTLEGKWAVGPGMHTHTNDVWIVVIKGAYLYKDAGENVRDREIFSGWHKHWSGGDKTEGALFYEEGSAKFNLVPAP